EGGEEAGSQGCEEARQAPRGEKGRGPCSACYVRRFSGEGIGRGFSSWRAAACLPPKFQFSSPPIKSNRALRAVCRALIAGLLLRPFRHRGPANAQAHPFCTAGTSQSESAQQACRCVRNRAREAAIQGGPQQESRPNRTLFLADL